MDQPCSAAALNAGSSQTLPAASLAIIQINSDMHPTRFNGILNVDISVTNHFYRSVAKCCSADRPSARRGDVAWSWDEQDRDFHITYYKPAIDVDSVAFLLNDDDI